MVLPKVYLASQSPRRKALLEACNIDFEIVQSGIDESDYPSDLAVSGIAEYLATAKAEAALSNIDDGIIIAADSLVINGNDVLGKPENTEEATAMLNALSGKRHEVITGVCIMDSEQKVTFSDISYVTFGDLDPDEIQYYVDTYKPMDKAGAYAIQEWIGHCKVVRIEGSYTNIMGLPTERVYRILKEWYKED